MYVPSWNHEIKTYRLLPEKSIGGKPNGKRSEYYLNTNDQFKVVNDKS